jgi:amidase
VADAAALLERLGHEVEEADLPRFTPAVGAAIGTMLQSAMAWIIGYWVRRLGREPGPDDLEPLTRAFWEAGKGVGAADHLLAVEELQRFSRQVAGFVGPGGYDAFLTPTLSEPPAPLGEMVSTPDDPWRSLERSSRTVRYAGVVANITGNPAMSVPLWWNADGLPIGVHVLGRFGDEATLFRLAGQLEAARPWRDRRPPVHVDYVRSQGRTGTRVTSTPVAARMAATTAGVDEMVGGSPTPLAPNGAPGSGISMQVASTSGASAIVGMR